MITRLDPGDRVLVTRLNYLGDVVLSLPLVDALHAACPGIEVDYLTRRPAADLIDNDPRFSNVFALGPGLRSGLSAVASLRARGYRVCIDLYSNPRSAWLTWLTGAPVRIGGARRGRRHFYTDQVRVPLATRRVTEVFLAYGSPLGVTPPANPRPVLACTVSELARAEKVLESAGVGRHGTRVGIHPGGKWPVKRWSAAKFAELAALLRAGGGHDVVLFTGPGEKNATEEVRALAAGAGVCVLPELDIRTVAAVIARLDAMVACDGGVMHVAAALGTPTVGIFGSSESEIWFPYAELGPFRAAEIAVPCRPCHAHECPLGTTACLNDLSARAVMAAVDAVMVGRGTMQS